MRREIEEMERVFSQTDNNFFQTFQEAIDMESQFSEYQKQADAEIVKLTQVVGQKEAELAKLQGLLDQQRSTHQSGFSLNNQSITMQSDAESIRTQLESLNQELVDEKK